jgi:acetyl esterase/lipase
VTPTGWAPIGPLRAASWQAHLVHWLVAARMRPHARRPIDPPWIRREMGRPRALRRVLANRAGVRQEERQPRGGWPGGEVLEATPPAHGPTVLYLHGGGYIACSPETHRMLVAALVARTGGRAWVPRYRLAPEHVYPAALDDAKAAYRHLLDVEQVDPARLVVMGDSAGGGLALALVQTLRDEGDPLPAAVVTFSPWTDLAATGRSLDENSARCSMFEGDTIRRAAPLYAGPHDPRTPGLSPLYGDFRGFPPLLVHASTDEVLRDDAIRVAERAAAQGVRVELRLWRRVPHVWQFFSAVLPEARESLDAMLTFLKSAGVFPVPERGIPRDERRSPGT